MSTVEALAELVKAAISGGNATSSTVTTLQSLLSSAPAAQGKATTTSQDTRSERPTSRTTKSAKTTRAPSKPARKDQTFKVLEDEPRSLAPKARHALATEIVNITLKILSDASKQPLKNHARRSSAQTSATPRRQSTTPASQRALQMRSGNETPVTQSPIKQPGARRRPSQCSISGGPSSPDHLVPTAECARLCFSFLRSIDFHKLGLREPPKLQLETGMLALCGKLIALELHSLATKELRAVKKRLESVFPGRQATKAAASKRPQPEETETLSGLLRVNINLEACPEVWPVVINLQLYALQVIAASNKPASIEEVAQFLESDSPVSPAGLFRRQVTAGGDSTKASKQLASLSRTLLQLCPNVASSADAAAKDLSRTAPPLAVFKIQTISLQLRLEGWRLAKQEIDLERDLVDPFSKCLAALVRRLPATKCNGDLFEACKEAYKSFNIAKQSSSKFTVLRTLSILAGRASMQSEAREYASQSLAACEPLGSDHARLVAAMARKSSVALAEGPAASTVDELCTELSKICESLRKSLSGSTSDYEILFAELADLVITNRPTVEVESLVIVQRRLAGAVGAFTSSYIRSFPNRNIDAAQEVIQAALSQCGSNEAFLNWVTKDTAQVLIRSGVLRRVTGKLASRPLALAWTSCSSAITLARILKLVLIKAASCQPKDSTNCVVDDEKLNDEERGGLLEWQLKCALETAHKSKYQPALKTLLPELFRRLATVYSLESFPLRRARIATQAYCIRDQFPELIAPHHLAAFTTTPLALGEGKLANDQWLVTYLPSIKASLELSTAFYNGRPATKDLNSILLALEDQLKSIEASVPLDQHVDNPSLLHGQLTSLYDYCELLGDDASRLKAAKLLCSLERPAQSGSMGRHGGALRLSRTYVSLGYAERAGEIISDLQKVSDMDEAPSLEALESLICKAEYMLVMQDRNGCQKVLELVNQARQDLQSKAPRLLQTIQYRLVLGRAWLLASRWIFESGSAHDSLAAAKRAVKVMNSIWSGLERSGKASESSAGVDEAAKGGSMEDLTSKVSKLVLKPEPKPSGQTPTQRKGAAFWPVAGLLVQALMHLADIYMHHGVFNEANYASQQALKFVEAIDSSQMLSRVRYHRSTLLTVAGQLEDAELCLAHDPNEDNAVPPLAKIEYFKAKAVLSVKNGDYSAAIKFYQQAEAIVKHIQSDAYVNSLESPQETDPQRKGETAAREAPLPKATANAARKRTTAQPRSKATTGRTGDNIKTVAGRKLDHASAVSKPPSNSTPRMLERLEAMLLLDKTIISVSRVHHDDEGLKRLQALAAHLSGSFKHRQLEHDEVMRKVYSELQADFSFNVLPESTLSFPALQIPDRRLSGLGSKGSLVPSTSQQPVKGAKAGKVVKRANTSTTSLAELLSAARRCILSEIPPIVSLSTAETHKQNLLVANASLVLSATSAPHASDTLHPVQEALAIDHGKIHAFHCYSAVARVDKEAHTSSDPLAWPQTNAQPTASNLTSKVFRDQFVDMLPRPWTTVSMSLNEACDELYITRYRCSQSPLIIRLPFSRQKSDEADDEVFDFLMGKEELKEIIELSNYSCHNSLDTKAKGAKTNWWNEREALDRRLQELLINMENIWLGGFKGIFSQHRADHQQLDRFRKTFEGIMDRHLSSRKCIKKGSKKLTLDDQILELFIGLGSDQDGEVDMDEMLADLLYFIVDILQFNGERNAYDEIDFDSMAIDVLDALRTYHDSVENESESTAHLILVLDKRLQVFPWESLPCLERCSVSRVDSMLTLKDRLAKMTRLSTGTDGHYTISRQSGSYILNPSSDLKGTETMLGPALSKLAASNAAGWSAVVGAAPSEDDFRDSLSKSSMLLYFGHGAGSQYISSRAIRRLDKCSEVVWLMGCSSGAVTEYDELEPVAVPLAYLVAGKKSLDNAAEGEGPSKCMAVVSNLWDVTDKDIDRFSLAVGEEWGLWRCEQESTKLPAKTPRKRERLAAPLTPERAAKTPKTPKVKKTPAPARTPARSRSRPSNGAEKKQSLVEAVAKSRDACYLRYLNGAAPVVYGVPVYLGD